MDYYLVNTQAQANGDHEVHKAKCAYLPAPVNRHGLGYHPTDQAALAVARKIYRQADGCAHCCPSIHRH